MRIAVSGILPAAGSATMNHLTFAATAFLGYNLVPLIGRSIALGAVALLVLAL